MRLQRQFPANALSLSLLTHTLTSATSRLAAGRAVFPGTHGFESGHRPSDWEIKPSFKITGA